MGKKCEKGWKDVPKWKKWLERDNNGNDILRFQNMIKMKSDAKIWERWKEMPQYAIVAM